MSRVDMSREKLQEEDVAAKKIDRNWLGFFRFTFVIAMKLSDN